MGAQTGEEFEHPSRYRKGGVELWDIEKERIGEAAFRQHIVSAALEYVVRYREKNGITDLKKALFIIRDKLCSNKHFRGIIEGVHYYHQYEGYARFVGDDALRQTLHLEAILAVDSLLCLCGEGTNQGVADKAEMAVLALLRLLYHEGADISEYVSEGVKGDAGEP